MRWTIFQLKITLKKSGVPLDAIQEIERIQVQSDEAIELLKMFAHNHDECDDGYYSCPKAENYFGSGYEKGETCTCGKDDVDAFFAKWGIK